MELMLSIPLLLMEVFLSLHANRGPDQPKCQRNSSWNLELEALQKQIQSNAHETVGGLNCSGLGWVRSEAAQWGWGCGDNEREGRPLETWGSAAHGKSTWAIILVCQMHKKAGFVNVARGKQDTWPESSEGPLPVFSRLSTASTNCHRICISIPVRCP